jgi:hypothetical protein
MEPKTLIIIFLAEKEQAQIKARETMTKYIH